jgi:hypothetical protein
VVTTKAPIVMAMKMRSATGPNILNTPKQISPQAKTKSIELSPRPRKPLLLRRRYPLSIFLSQLAHGVTNPHATPWLNLDKSSRGAGCNDAG